MSGTGNLGEWRGGGGTYNAFVSDGGGALAFAAWWLATSIALAQDVAAHTVDPTVEAELGQGVTVSGSAGGASFQLRGRLQQRVSAKWDGNDVGVAFQVRRLRLVFIGRVPQQSLQFYIQLGLSPQDSDLSFPTPLADASVAWTPVRDFGLRVGQQKVPFNRERVVSSSALQFPDRSLANGEFNLDRDVGVQAFSNDLFGWDGRLSYQLGVFNGDGRNRAIGDRGLLYIARLEVRPLGVFPDSYAQADIDRGPPRLALGAAVVRNSASDRARSNHGDTYDGVTFSHDQAEMDALFKAYGFSLHAEALARRSTPDQNSGILPRSGWGWSAASGYVFPSGLEPALRISEVYPLQNVASAVEPSRELRAGLSWYGHGHDLKLQTDLGRVAVGDSAVVEARSQLQVYF